MNNIIMNGKIVADNIIKECNIKLYNTSVILCVIKIGSDEASNIYIERKRKAALECGITFLLKAFDDTVNESTVISLINDLNRDNNVYGIIVQLPISKHLNKEKIINTIDPKKDVDGLSALNIGIFPNGMIPCTALGCMKILEYYNITLQSKKAVVIGRSDLVGKPLAMLLLQNNATVTICHSYTKDLQSITKEADILCVCAGQKWLIDESYIKQDVVIIDVGIHRDVNDITGDIHPNCYKKASFYTPVPGGVGPTTVACLIWNTIKSFKQSNNHL